MHRYLDFLLSQYVKMVIALVLIFAGAEGINLLLNRVLQHYLRRRNIDEGRQLANPSFQKNGCHVNAYMMVTDAIVIRLSALMLGSSGLSAGIGCRLSQTFNDLDGGFVPLVEGGMIMGDDLIVEGVFGSFIFRTLSPLRVAKVIRYNVFYGNSESIK